jgi:membrane protein YqaA with SNARE-associated domain
MIESRMQNPENPDDQAAFRRWRIGFFAFYGAVALLLAGLATIADRVATASARIGPASAAVDTTTHPN